MSYKEDLQSNNVNLQFILDTINQLADTAVKPIVSNTLTDITGIFKGDGSILSAAVAGEDYAIPAKDVIIILSTNWLGDTAPYFQVVSIEGMTTDKKIQVSLANEVTTEQYNAATAAQLMCSAQGDGEITIKAFGVKPEIEIPIIIREIG